MSTTLLIMAAGSGSRYGALKQFDGLGPDGEFLFEFLIYDALAAGFDHLVLITKREFVEDIGNYLQTRLPATVRIDVLAQEQGDLPTGVSMPPGRKKPWGTAHAVWVARNHIDGPFAVANADDFYGREAINNTIRFLQSNRNRLTFGSVPYTLRETLSSEGSVSRAVCMEEEGYLRRIVEYKEIVQDEKGIRDLESGDVFTGEEVTSMNFWVFYPEVFALIEQDLIAFFKEENNLDTEEVYIPKQAQQWIVENRARVRLTPACDDWFGVTYANDKSRARERLLRMTEQGHYPSPLWKG